MASERPPSATLVSEEPLTRPSEKAQFSPDTIEFTRSPSSSTTRTLRPHSTLTSIRQAVTLLTLLMALSIVGTSGNALFVYNRTHVGRDYYLPLWPYNFELGPEVALVAGGGVMVLCDLLSLVSSRVALLHPRRLPSTILSLIAPLAGLIAAIVATSFFYSINASDTVDTLQSWSCRWSEVPMSMEPYFGTLCRQSQAGLYMIIALIPLHLITLGLATWGFWKEKKGDREERGKGSPNLDS